MPTTPPPPQPVNQPSPNFAPFFIIGTERSGSNLLRLILNAHSGLAIPHPPHILKFFTPLLPGYGDLTHPQNLRRLSADVLALLRVHIYPWEIELSAEQIFQGTSEPSLLGIYYAIYNAYLAASGKRRWGCKSTFMIHHVAEILATCPQAKFIFLVRDPRDVAVSSRKSVFSPFHPYFTARLWRQQQLEGIRLLDSPQADHLFLVRYEDLIRQPEPTVRKICAFLGEIYEPAMLEFYQTDAAQKSNRLSTSWQNTASPIQPQNMNKFKRELTPTELLVVEAVTGDLMQRFDYALTEKEIRRLWRGPDATKILPYRPSLATHLYYRLLDFSWFLKVEGKALCHDKNFGLRWRRQLLVLALTAKSHLRRTLASLHLARRP